jgi:hypothetical protein
MLTLNLASASKLSYRVGCGFDAGCPTVSFASRSPNFFASGVEIFGSVVSVTDSKAPGLWVADTGLFGGGDVAGTSPVDVQSASDESGIKRLAVFVDGGPAPVGLVNYEQDVNQCDWATPAPCKNASEVEVPVDTRQLTDGVHSFVVKAFDAAGNETSSSTHYATVKNAAASNPTPDPPAPDPTPTPTPTPDPPGPGTTPTGPGTPGGTGLPNGISSGEGSSGAAPSGGPKLSVAFDRNGKATLKAKYGRMVVLRGHLTGGAGAAIADAQVEYNALVTKAGARVQHLGSVRTDSTGAFTLSVATKLGSRNLRFAYGPQIGGPIAATASAQLNVVAPITLKVGPKRVRNKRAVVFRGRLGAGPIPRKGKLVNLQVVVDRHWHTFATVRSAKSGRFKYRYRFMRTYGRVTYRFRARSRYEAAYPFVAGSSKAVRVRVNGCPCE